MRLGIVCNASSESNATLAAQRVESCFQATGCPHIREHFTEITPSLVAAVKTARKHGGRVILMPLIQAGMAPEDYADLCVAAVGEFESFHIEFGNEPGYPWQTPSVPADMYARFVKAAGIAVEASRDPAKKVTRLAAVDGGYAPDWWAKMVAAVPDVANYFDGCATHPYHNQQRPGDVKPLWPWGISVPYIWTRKTVYVTECGAATGTDLVGNTAPGITDDEQAQWLRDAHRMASSYPYVFCMFVYMDHDTGASKVDALQNAGVARRYDGSLKPAAAVFRELMASDSAVVRPTERKTA